MADTVVQANNKLSSPNRRVGKLDARHREFPTKNEEAPIPSVSKNQNAAMHAAAEGESTIGIPQKVGAEFVAATPPGGVKDLPQHVGADPRHDDDEETKEMRARADHMHKQGHISEAQHADMHAKIDAMKKAKRPNLQASSDPDAAEERDDSPHDRAESDGETRPNPRAA